MSPRRPQDLIFTLFGEYLEHLNRPIWVGSLSALPRPFQVSENAVRTVLSRLMAKRWLVARRVGVERGVVPGDLFRPRGSGAPS